MSLVAASHTLGAVERLTRQNVLRRHLRETGLGLTSTATGGSTTTIVDTTRLKSSQYADTDWVGAFARIARDAGGAAAAPELEIRPITAYAPSTGTVTVDPAFTVAPANGDTYEIWRMPHPQVVLDTLDQIMEQDVLLPAWAILTEAPDGDMEQNNTTDWAGTRATVTKSTSQPSMYGTRWLSVVTTSAGGYASSATLRVRPSERYHVSALVRTNAASTTAELIAWDNTNGAAITSKTSTRQDVVRLWFEFTTPSDCYQVVLRLSNVENTTTTFWDEVCFYAIDTAKIRLPWWVKQSGMVKSVHKLRPLAIGTNMWDPTLRGEQDNSWDFADDWEGDGHLSLVARYGAGMSWPLYVKGTRNATAWANENTETKHIDGNWVAACLNYRVFEILSAYQESGPPEVNGWIQKKLADYKKEYETQKRKQVLRGEVEQRSPSPDTFIYRDNFAGDDWIRRVR